MTDAQIAEQLETDYNDYLRDLHFGERGEARRNVERIGREDVARFNRLIEKIITSNREEREARARNEAEVAAREAAAADAKAAAERIRAERGARLAEAIQTDPMIALLANVIQRLRIVSYRLRPDAQADVEEANESLINALDVVVQTRQQ